MSRLLSPDDACKAVEVPFGRAQKYQGTTIEVSDPVHLRALKSAGYTVADSSGAPSRARGFSCPDCNFRSYFRLCSRCGAAATSL